MNYYKEFNDWFVVSYSVGNIFMKNYKTKIELSIQNRIFFQKSAPPIFVFQFRYSPYGILRVKIREGG